jgi:S1-C subfamily serine protease
MPILRRPEFRFFLFVLSGFAAVGVVAALAFARGNPIGTGVVVIDTNLGYQGGAAAGSGMVLTSSGTVLTNNHVIAGATTIRIVVPNTAHSYKATVVGYDKSADVAVLRLEGASNLRTISVAKGTPSVGQAVRAVGNAGGTGSLTSAKGVVTGLNRSIVASDEQSAPERLTGLIETNAGVQPGDSGGPLLDSADHVVGMDTAASANSAYSANSSDAYAIPIGKALTIVKQILGGKASATVHVGATAFLGVEVEPVDGFGDGGYATSGALIAGVVPGGPAASAGLTAGDVITAIDGRSVASPDQVSPVILAKKPGARIMVAYVDRNGNGYTTTVKLGTGPAQ